MERHKCKLCSKVFGNGRALGGHMRSHLATLPIPPKTQQQQRLGDPTESASSLSFSEDEERGNEDIEEKALVYGLRENPKKSFRLVDPEFLDAGSIVVQDRESETESSRNPTRRRSNRARRKGFATEDDHHHDQGLKKAPKLRKPSWTESAAALEPVSSVSDASPEENVAMWLVMLSRDTWSSDDSDELRLSQNLRKQQFQALSGERTSQFEGNKSASERGRNVVRTKNTADQKLHECPICFKVFGSGQALGGHKRSHFASSSAKSTNDSKNSAKSGERLIDLNLPAPMEDEELSQLELSAVYNPE